MENTKQISVDEARQYLLENLERPKSLIMHMNDKAVIAAYQVTARDFDKQAIESLMEG